MAAAKNYAAYREEFAKLLADLAIDKRHDSLMTSKPDDSSKVVQNTVADKVDAIVPHLAVHIAALTSVAECHEDFLQDNAHMYNLVKWKLTSNLLLPIQRLQKLKYPFQPVRIISLKLHHAWRAHMHRGSQSAADAAKRLYLLSEKLERNINPAVGR